MPEDPQIIRECLAAEYADKIMEKVKLIIYIRNVAVLTKTIREISELLHKLETVDEELNKIVYGEI